ncbi:unnamed protein product [Nezara viridula]|uniref:Uncharacterized protein n=1 Tax=Nezara viridula TaxID=85310 RepID=A0A9P0H5J7_NEZVI|nr:unnamed protein product [Nezara viridula]
MRFKLFCFSVSNTYYIQLNRLALGRTLDLTEPPRAVRACNPIGVSFRISGFSPEIPGFPRYKMIGDFNNGVYNLNIINASLEDDAQFQCQVGPHGFHKPIRANANLSVICE